MASLPFHIMTILMKNNRDPDCKPPNVYIPRMTEILFAKFMIMYECKETEMRRIINEMFQEEEPLYWLQPDSFEEWTQLTRWEWLCEIKLNKKFLKRIYKPKFW